MKWAKKGSKDWKWGNKNEKNGIEKDIKEWKRIEEDRKFRPGIENNVISVKENMIVNKSMEELLKIGTEKQDKWMGKDRKG